MRIHALRWLALSALLGFSAAAPCAQNWVLGTNYFPISPAQPTAVAPGKVEVTEVFSYACPACNHFYPIADRLKAALPANAQMDYVPAGFNPSEDWPMFQRAYYTAQLLGVDKRTHDAMFDAIWKTGELATIDPRTDELKSPAPSIQDAAKFYQRVAGVKAATFVATADSFVVDLKVRQADQYIKDTAVPSTPTIIVNGKYRLDPESAGGYDELIDLVKWLVAKESSAAAAKSAH